MVNFLPITQGIGAPLTQPIGYLWRDTLAWTRGFDLWKDFVADFGNLSNPTDTHAQTIYAPNAAGAYSAFAPNVLVRTDLGLQTVPTRTNLFASPLAPATQVVTVVAATAYVVSITGPGSITLSGAGSGVVTAGNPVTFTAGSTLLTCTVSGSPASCNVTTGTFAVPPLSITGTVNGNQQVITGLGTQLATGVAGFVQLNILEPGSNYVNQLRFYDFASGVNRAFLFYAAGRLLWEVRDNNVVQANMDIAAFPSGVCTIAFIATANYFNACVVGQAAVAADTSGTWPVIDAITFGGVGSGAASNTYQFTRKIALDFLAPGDDPATVWAATYAKAVLAAA